MIQNYSEDKKTDCYINSNVKLIFVKPNPIYDCFEINNLKVKEIYSYQILNLSGQIVQSNFLNENMKICLQNINQGIYLLKLSNSETNTIIKIVKSNKN
ncbi:MAG: T9SS type A sorting domain-containing protein [Saprospiraceae bacterium]|nr:T9SS type A sorting domain-containing protein [Saprospiraceae bacterium]